MTPEELRDMCRLPDDVIALNVGRRVLAWMRNPVGVAGVFTIEGDDSLPFAPTIGYRVTVDRMPLSPYEDNDE